MNSYWRRQRGQSRRRRLVLRRPPHRREPTPPHSEEEGERDRPWPLAAKECEEVMSSFAFSVHSNKKCKLYFIFKYGDLRCNISPL